MNIIKKSNRRVVAFFLVLVMLILTFIPTTIKGITLTDEYYTTEYAKRSWDSSIYNNADRADEVIPTGLAFNWTTYSKTGANWPFSAQAYLTQRPGYEKEEYEMFNNRFIYCVANHVQNYRLGPGMQAFHFGTYTTEDPFSYAQKGATEEQQKFNFMMLAIATNYPGEIDYNPESKERIADALICQMIAWLATDENNSAVPRPGFCGDFATDFNYFKGSNVYYELLRSFTADQEPEIYNYLRQAPPAGSGASQHGITTMLDAIFYDIWVAADFACKLDINWTEEFASYNTQIIEENGEYHAYVDLWTSESAKEYFTGAKFVGYGDWTEVGVENGIAHYKSTTGETDEKGSIGHYEWPEELIGYYAPLDIAKAKLFTFTFYNDTVAEAGQYKFFNGQTYFASVIERGLELYVTIGEKEPEPGDGEVHVDRYEHEENFSAAYNVNLRKYDAETGKPLADSHWDILESFDDSQLDKTNLDLLEVGEYTSNIGSLNNTSWEDGDDIETNYNGDTGLNESEANLYNWKNDDGTQFDKWTDPYDDPCLRDDNVTGDDGLLYEISSDGSASSTPAHTDIKRYTYNKGYCGGHPAPEIEYQELTGDPELDEQIDEENQQLHDETWAAWLEEVQKCEDLVKEGGFFHAIESGVAQEAMEADRDQFYKDFISLEYEYSAEEIKAPTGYILHGTHTDDIPIEWRIVTSSEYKDTDEATNIDHTGGSSSNEDDEEENIETESINDKQREESFYFTSGAYKEIKKATPSDAEENDDEISDEFIFIDEDEFNIASSSEISKERVATDSNALPETQTVESGYTSNRISLMSDDEEDNEDTETTSSNRGEGFLESIANRVSPPDDSIIDWTFIVYNHRTEGELHINKQDFDLENDDSDTWSSYSISQGDGTLEGAIYGLFAANDIEHPDGHTGTIYKKDNLVAIATTDRNGDASFLTFTEAPGYTYDYETGSIVKTEDGWSNEAPKNLYTSEDESANKEDDIESFIGHNPDNSEITAGNGKDLIDTSTGDNTYIDEWFKKYSSNQGYEDTWTSSDTSGYYPISNNELNNGNCWIGRPLIVEPNGTQYYIKELSRSEGYELSVYGKDDTLLTNREAFEAGGSDFTSGKVSATDISEDRTHGGATYSITSSGTQNGYVVTITNVPENATFNMTSVEYVWDDNVTHEETILREENILAEAGTPVKLNGKTWKANIGDTIEYNGKTFTVNNTYTISYEDQQVNPNNQKRIENPYLDVSTITPTGNVMNDINGLFLSNGFKKTIENAPWISVKVDSYDTNSVAAAINEQIFTNDTYSVYNAMQMMGSYTDSTGFYVAIAYDYHDTSLNNALYNEANNKIYVKTDVEYTSPSGGTLDGFAYRIYDLSECKDVETNNNGFVTSVVVPNEISSGNPLYMRSNLDNELTFIQRPSETYWAYADGEYLLKDDGSIATKTVTETIDVSPTLVPKVTNTEINIDSYTPTGEGVGTYKYTISQDLIDGLENGTINFRVLFNNSTVTVNGKEVDAVRYVFDNALIGIELPFGSADSYIESTTLFYPGQDTIVSDDDTQRNPIQLYERPIRQRVKVVKDIQTNEDGSYAHDTYSKVHSENLAPDEYNRWYEKIADWLTNLINGNDENNDTSILPNFRFKAYLKSNLERLYRNNDGEIVWLDRNGNALVPNYQDTNNDGNYDTFIWESGENDINFPEKDKINDDVLQSSNVQKIYTEVDHNSTSTTTGDISNNTWAEYADPQTGETTDVGSLRGYNTSQDGDNGEAINTNDSLYSYDDKNTNVAESDKINENQNQGYTRLLETTVNTVEDGAGKTREVEQYNYEKFFDAIAAANTDKWDNDMYTTYDGHEMENYPGQHWFDTFEERYQKDDADLDGTLENTDGVDADGTAGGDRDTSFKPFQWIREQLFGTTEDAKNDYPATHDNDNLENDINVGDVNHNDSDIAHINAEASDAVRAFAIKWYLDDEVAKLVTNNGYDEDVAKKGSESYQEEVYDQALFNALEKTYNYIRPFYNYDLDTIYSVEWDTATNGGKDGDYTTLSADTLYNDEYYYGVSAYLPYGTYILVEQQPYTDTLDDFTNKHYKVDKPKEVTLPSVYEADGNNTSPEVFDDYYNYNSADTPEQLAEKYFIRFNEEWSESKRTDDDLRNYVIRAHNYDGDFEVYKYGLDVDKLIDTITYTGGSYDYSGFKITQDQDPLKNYYNTIVDTEHEGGNTNSHYYADDKNKGIETANGSTYADDAIERRYHYGSISENAGTADNVIYQHGNATDDNNPSGFYFKDNVKTMTGNQTAYEGKYASMLVPWTVIEPVDAGEYDSNTFSGYADGKFRNTFYTTKFRIEKLDSETGEQILHDDAIFALYAASRYTSQAEIEEAGAPKGTEIGDVKFYMEDTTITGSKEFLESMGAVNIEPVSRGVGDLYSGTVSAGTPVCVEEEQIILTDQAGNKTGQFKFYTTLADVETLNEEDTDKSYKDQNVGYLVTPEPLGAGVYVLAETKAPTGYAKTKPIAVEVYSDGVTYYMNGLMDSQVDATIYESNLIK